MNTVSIDQPDLTTKELPAGIDPDAVATRKRAAMATGTTAAVAEANAIQAEQIQLDRDAAHTGSVQQYRTPIQDRFHGAVAQDTAPATPEEHPKA